MVQLVRLRVKLIDEASASNEENVQPFIFLLNPLKHKLIRDLRVDLAAKLRVDAAKDLEVSVDDGTVIPGFTVTAFLYENELIIARIVPKGKNDELEPEESFAASELEFAVIDEPPPESRLASVVGQERLEYCKQLLVYAKTHERGGVTTKLPRFSAATIISTRHLVTYWHNDHAHWQRGDKVVFHAQFLCPSPRDIPATVWHVANTQDFIVLQSEAEIKIKGGIDIQYTLYEGLEYWQLGYSARHEIGVPEDQQNPLCICDGVIASTRQDILMHMRGTSGARRGDSGCPIVAKQGHGVIGVVLAHQGSARSGDSINELILSRPGHCIFAPISYLNIVIDLLPPLDGADVANVGDIADQVMTAPEDESSAAGTSSAFPSSRPRQNAAAGAQVAQMQFRAPLVGGARGVPMTTTGNFLKPSMQCFHWDSPTHIKTSCRFWHPHKLCKNFPLCTHGAMACGFAHPFCSESGEFCACPPHARDPQKNHRRKMAPPGAAAAQAAAMDGQQQLVGEDYTFD